MATFTDDVGNNTIDASTGTINGFTGGTLAELQDTIGDAFITGLGNDVVVAGSGNDTITVSSGIDNINGGAGDDLLIVNYSADTDNFSSGGGFISDFSNTQVSFAGIERFDVSFGTGNDNVALGAGNDTASMGDGNDTINTLAGDASVNGGNGADLWAADLSAETVGLRLNLNLAGVQTIGGGNFATNIEALSLIGGLGNDVLKSRTIDNPDTAINDSINGFNGNDIIAVGGGIDTADGGAGNDLLVIDYSGDDDSFSMNGANVISDFANTQINFSNFERFDVRLGSGNDNILLGAGSDSISGGAGNDVLNTARGAAVVDGGLGTDTWGADLSTFVNPFAVDLNVAGVQNIGNASSLTGIEALNVTGSKGNDILKSRTIDNPDAAINDSINGFSGNDTIAVGGGIDTADGGTGSDLLIIDYSGDDDSFSMNGANAISDFTNTQINFSNFERFDVRLGSGNDNIMLGAGDDSINGGSGNDILNTAAGAAVVDGGTGNDTWAADLSAFVAPFTVDLNLVALQNIGNASSLVNVEALKLIGSTGDDILKSRTIDNPDFAINDSINGFVGNDTIVVGGGIDTADGGAGNDLLVIDYSGDDDSFSMNGANVISDFANTQINFSNFERLDARFGSGNDNVILGGGDDSISGGGGNDILNTATGAAVVDGGTGNDTWAADLSSFVAPFTIDLNLVALQNIGNASSLVNVEALNVTGSTGNDTLKSRTIDNPDTQINDSINGFDGNDTIAVGGGNDTADGGAGNDLLIIDYSGDDDSFVSNGAAQITDFANTVINYSNFERIDARFGSGNDNVNLGAGDDSISGGTGNDTLNGDAGNDSITGGVGADRLDGGAGTGDTVSYAASVLGVIVNLANNTASGGDAAGDIISGFENITGSAAADRLTGSGGRQYHQWRRWQRCHSRRQRRRFFDWWGRRRFLRLQQCRAKRRNAYRHDRRFCASPARQDQLAQHRCRYDASRQSGLQLPSHGRRCLYCGGPSPLPAGRNRYVCRS